MAIDILEGEKNTVHNYHHDLESLFYVLIWVCTMYSGPNGAVRDKMFNYKESVLSVWNGEMIGKGRHFPLVAWSKRAVMMNPLPFNNQILTNFSPYFDPIKEDIEKLRNVLFPTALSSYAVDVIEKVVGNPDSAESLHRLDPLLVGVLRGLLPPSHQVASDLFAQMRNIINSAIDRLKQNPPPDPGHSGGGAPSSSQRYPGILGKTFNVLHQHDPVSMPLGSSKQGVKRRSKAQTEDIAPESADQENEVSFIFFRKFLRHGTPDAVGSISPFSRRSFYPFSRRPFRRSSVVPSQGSRSKNQDDPFID